MCVCFFLDALTHSKLVANATRLPAHFPHALPTFFFPHHHLLTGIERHFEVQYPSTAIPRERDRRTDGQTCVNCNKFEVNQQRHLQSTQALVRLSQKKQNKTSYKT